MAIAVKCPKCGATYKLDNALAGKKGRCKACKEVFAIPKLSAKPAKHRPEPPSPKPPAPKPAPATAPTALPPQPTPQPKPVPSTPFIDVIQRHLTRRIAAPSHVFSQRVSEIAHVDLLVIPPTREAPSEKHPHGVDHFTIVTAGLSSRAMSVPTGDESPRIAELMVALPDKWPGINPDGSFDARVMQDPRYWWPIEWLRTVARMPHEQNTFLAAGHTIPNGPRAEPFAANTRLGAMLIFPSTLSHRATRLKLNDQYTLNFFSLYPLYPEELQFKMKNGVDALVDKMMEAQMTELINPDRPSICR